MRTLAEPQFHLLMASLVLAALFLEQQGPRWLPGWSVPQIGLLTFTLGMCWLALFAGHRIRNLHQRIAVLEDRLDRTMQRTDTLEDDARHRRGLPLR